LLDDEANLKRVADETEGASVFGPLWETFASSITVGIVMKLLQSILNFASPLILKYVGSMLVIFESEFSAPRFVNS